MGHIQVIMGHNNFSNPRVDFDTDSNNWMAINPDIYSQNQLKLGNFLKKHIQFI